MQDHSITLRWGISRGKDTYGYNVLTARDSFSRKRIADASGGGYDLTNTVLCDVISKLYHKEFQEAYLLLSPYQQRDSFRHIQRNLKTGNAWADGAVGEQATRQLLDLVGLDMESIKVDSNTTVVNFKRKQF